ncbi:MAG: tryptophan-rich sensory protein, partial [Patescibacteria group bacterium]|nr:tryptophan-rich sensory protein [Patescibacteria group bacterium]
MIVNRRSFFKLIISILVPQIAGGIGSFFTAPEISIWFSTLQKPAFNPPSWVFAPVWTTLYFLMGIAAFLVWERGWNDIQIRKALGIYSLQLILNVLWSIIFFGLHSPFWALIDLILLWLAILLTMVSFHKISRPAAYLLTPYIAWVSFA